MIVLEQLLDLWNRHVVVILGLLPGLAGALDKHLQGFVQETERDALRVLLIDERIGCNLLRMALYVAEGALVLYRMASIFLESLHGLSHHKLESILVGTLHHETDIRQVVLTYENVHLFVDLALHGDEQRY